MTWDEFYRSTPFQVKVRTQAWAENRKDSVKSILLGAYSTARLHHTSPKYFPQSFDEWIGKPKSFEQQTPEQFASALLRRARKNGLKDD